MKTAKKLIALLIACVFVVGLLAACGESGGSAPAGSGNAGGGAAAPAGDKSEIVIGYAGPFTGALAEFT